MKRLTSKNPLTEKEALNLSLTDLYMRLKAYEDTGLEPAEVACFLGATDEFTEILKRSATTIQLADPPYAELLHGIMCALQDIACILQGIAKEDKECAP